MIHVERAHGIHYIGIWAGFTGQDTQDLISSLGIITGSILRWPDNNRLIRNKDKSLTLGFNHKSNKHIVFPAIVLKNTQIIYIPELKFLGLWLDNNLNWDCHVENLIIILKQTQFCNCSKPFINKNIVKIMCFAYINYTYSFEHKTGLL
jgi:hypothetical protein